jgi:membrane protease YdiL (CAAX protease family)
MSLRKLVGWTVFDLGLALLIGTGLAIAVFAVMFPYRPARELAFCRGLNSLGVPLTAPGLREKYDRASSEWRYALEVDCQATPADDQRLVDWLKDQSTFELEKIERLPSVRGSGATAARVQLSLIGPKGQKTLDVPWERLGYKIVAWPPLWIAHGPFMQDGPPLAVFRLMLVGFLQIGFLVVGLVRWWRNRRVAAEPAPRGEGQALLAALGVAVLLTGLFWAYVQAGRHFFGPASGLAYYLTFIPSAGWFMPLPYQGPMMTVQPPFLQLVAGVVMVLGFPLAQELFFRGGMLGMWTRTGWFKAGAVLTAVAAALLLLDWTIFPVVLVAGLALAWLYHWSRSLLATLLAHITFNAAILCMVFGLIPSLPHPVEQLCGVWEEVSAEIPKVPGKSDGKPQPPKPAGDQAVVPVKLLDFTALTVPLEIEFLRGGTIRGGRVVSKDVQLTPQRYEWVGQDEIEVRWERVEHVGPMAINVTLDLVRYKVAVSWKELTLTRQTDGKVFRYRRADAVYRGRVTAPKSL